MNSDWMMVNKHGYVELIKEITTSEILEIILSFYYRKTLLQEYYVDNCERNEPLVSSMAQILL